MGKVLMWVGIVIGGVFIIVFLFSTLMPQSMADFFMSMASSEYEIELDGREHKVMLETLGDGVEPADRLFVMKKMIALHVLADYESEYEDERNSFNELLLAASEDNALSSSEFLDLKKLHEDVVPEERVNDWIGMAKELEELDELKEHKELEELEEIRELEQK